MYRYVIFFLSIIYQIISLYFTDLVRKQSIIYFGQKIYILVIVTTLEQKIDGRQGIAASSKKQHGPKPRGFLYSYELDRNLIQIQTELMQVHLYYLVFLFFFDFREKKLIHFWYVRRFYRYLNWRSPNLFIKINLLLINIYFLQENDCDFILNNFKCKFQS